MAVVANTDIECDFALSAVSAAGRSVLAEVAALQNKTGTVYRCAASVLTMATIITSCSGALYL